MLPPTRDPKALNSENLFPDKGSLVIAFRDLFLLSTPKRALVWREKRYRLVKMSTWSRIKISINTDISIIRFYENIENIGKISMNIFIKISFIKIFHILII